MKKTRIRITLPEPFIVVIDQLVEEGLYLDRVEIVMEALRRLFVEKGREPFASAHV